MARKSIDLSQLPPPDLVETLDFESLRASILDDVKARLAGTSVESMIDFESEPLVKLVEAFAFREMLMRQRGNDLGRATMLATAQGADLENLGALLNVSRQDGESDGRLRERIQLAHESFTAAGTAGAYEWHALDASQEVADVATFRQAPGRVDIIVLGTGSALTADAMSAVRQRLTSEEVAPLTDDVSVREAKDRFVDVDADLYLYLDPDADTVRFRARRAVQSYADRVHRIGFDMTRSGLINALHAEGVQRVDLHEPATDLVVQSDEVSRLNSVTIRVAGRAE